VRPGDFSSFRWWVCPLLLALAAFCFDAADRRLYDGLLVTGLLDDPAHLAAAALGLLVVARFVEAPRRFYVAALIASVAIDLDHIPLYLGFGAQNQRPVTHSLATVVVCAVAAVASRRHRAVLAGTVAGLLLHFARDIAEGPPGVRMLWPLQQTAWIAGYWWFFGMIVLLMGADLMLGGLGIPRTRRRVLEYADERLQSTAAEPAAPPRTLI
jgi:LexA-binding, inner membrane-associated putative hydrolase